MSDPSPYNPNVVPPPPPMPPPSVIGGQGHVWLAPGPPEVVHSGSAIRAFLFALAAAALCGGLWIAIIVGTDRIWFYAAFVIGIAAAAAAERGWSVPGDARAIVTAIATALAMVVTLYFGFRHLVGRDAGVELPVWLGFSSAFELVKIGVKAEPLVGICSAAAVVIAAVKARR